jgi:hypothetical protein
MTEAHPFTPMLTRTYAPCVACNAAYRREALALMVRLSEHAPPTAWPAPAMREAVTEVNNDPTPYEYVTCFRATLHDDGVSAVDIPAAQHCAACEALSFDTWQ